MKAMALTAQPTPQGHIYLWRQTCRCPSSLRQWWVVHRRHLAQGGGQTCSIYVTRFVSDWVQREGNTVPPPPSLEAWFDRNHNQQGPWPSMLLSTGLAKEVITRTDGKGNERVVSMARASSCANPSSPPGMFMRTLFFSPPPSLAVASPALVVVAPPSVWCPVALIASNSSSSKSLLSSSST
jgi:hypothetical protein